MISLLKLKDNFSGAASLYENYADIQKKTGCDLLARLLADPCEYKSILDIGCGTGVLLKSLKRHFPDSFILGVDISLDMATQARAKMLNSQVADAMHLPFKLELFDLALSNAVYQWVPDLPSAFQEALRVLKKQGLLLFSCFGSNTLKELRSCFAIRENTLPTKEVIIDSLKGAGFSWVEFSTTLQYKYFNSLTDILYWLKHTGANQINTKPPLFTPGRLGEANHLYSSNYRNNGRVYASFEVFWVKARK